MRDEYKRILKEGIDPTVLKQQEKMKLQEKATNTFENIALGWYADKWTDTTTKDAKLCLSRLKRYVLPYIGSIPIKDISHAQIIEISKNLESKDRLAEARKTRSIINQIFKYAIATKKAKHNLITETAGAYKQPEKRHYAYFSEKEFKNFIHSLNTKFRGNLITKQALKFLILIFVRSGELRGASWEEFDFDEKEWRIPAERMKMKEQHIVPLSKQALKLLEEIKQNPAAKRELLFPSCRDFILINL